MGTSSFKRLPTAQMEETRKSKGERKKRKKKVERARDKERKWERDRERTRAGQLSTKWKQRICDKEYLSVPVVYCPQGAGWTFQLALFLSHSPCTSPLNRVKSACLQMEIDGCCLHHHPQASGVWAFFASLSESGPVCKLPTDESKSCELCMLYYFFKRRTSQQTSVQSYRKAKKKKKSSPQNAIMDFPVL